MGLLADLVAVLVETFGVFLLPAGVFLFGVALYALLWGIGKVRGGDDG